MSQPVALVTGASSGIGEATARELIRLGYTVYGAARRTERLAALAADGVVPLAMDVTDDASMQAGVERVLADTGRIDLLVNNAGYGSYGALEDVPLEEGRRQFEVNVFGPMRLAQLVLPGMRERGSGLIVNVSSMGGKFTLPEGGWYHGTKHALEALSDALRMEAAPFGVDVVVIEPGAIATEWGGIAADHLERTSGEGPYAEQAAAISALLRHENGRTSSPPSVIARAVAKAAAARRPRPRYAVGAGAKPLIALRRVLPDRQWDFLISLATGFPRRARGAGGVQAPAVSAPGAEEERVR